MREKDKLRTFLLPLREKVVRKARRMRGFFDRLTNHRRQHKACAQQQHQQRRRQFQQAHDKRAAS